MASSPSPNTSTAIKVLASTISLGQEIILAFAPEEITQALPQVDHNIPPLAELAPVLEHLPKLGSSCFDLMQLLLEDIDPNSSAPFRIVLSDLQVVQIKCYCSPILDIGELLAGKTSCRFQDGAESAAEPPTKRKKHYHDAENSAKLLVGKEEGKVLKAIMSGNEGVRQILQICRAIRSPTVPVLKKVVTSMPSVPSDLSIVEDIGTFIASVMAREPKFLSWPSALRGHAQQVVKQSAGGVMRWAVCQLDILRHERTSAGVYAALDDLPVTMQAIYQKVMSLVDTSDRPMLRHVLEMVEFFALVDMPLSPALLLESFVLLAVTEGRDYAFYDQSSLRDVCGCLIAFTSRGSTSTASGGLHVQFAHVTVREFLMADNQRQFLMEEYQLDFATVAEKLIQTVFAYNLRTASAVPRYIEGTGPDAPSQGFEAACISISFKILSGRFLLPQIKDNDSLRSMAHTLLGLEHGQRFLTRYSKIHPRPVIDPIIWHEPTREGPAVTALHLLTTWAAHSPLLLDLFDTLVSRGALQEVLRAELAVKLQLEDYSSDKPLTPAFRGTFLSIVGMASNHTGFHAFFEWPLLGQLLDTAVGDDVARATQLLIDSLPTHKWKCTCYDNFDDEEEPYESLEHTACPIKHLLDRGGDPNASGSWVTPLQIAAALKDLAAVQLLLDAGADPARVGDPTGMQWRNTDFMALFNKLHGWTPLLIWQEEKPLRLDHSIADCSDELEQLREDHSAMIAAVVARLEKPVGKRPILKPDHSTMLPMSWLADFPDVSESLSDFSEDLGEAETTVSGTYDVTDPSSSRWATYYR